MDTPNSGVKKSNPHQFIASAAARAAPAGRDAASGDRCDKMMKVMGKPQFFDSRVRGTPSF